MRILSMIALLLLTVFVSGSTYPPLPASSKELRRFYISRLISYEGTPYAVSGNPAGISCSGLVCQAIIDSTAGAALEGPAEWAHLHTGLRAHPCLADQLMRGCDGTLSPVCSAPDFLQLNYARLEPGDVAVVGKQVGLHTLAYLGGREWIAASAKTGHVTRIKGSDISQWWFGHMPVKVLRWNVFRGVIEQTASLTREDAPTNS